MRVYLIRFTTTKNGVHNHWRLVYDTSFEKALKKLKETLTQDSFYDNAIGFLNFTIE